MELVSKESLWITAWGLSAFLSKAHRKITGMRPLPSSPQKAACEGTQLSQLWPGRCAGYPHEQLARTSSPRQSLRSPGQSWLESTEQPSGGWSTVPERKGGRGGLYWRHLGDACVHPRICVYKVPWAHQQAGAPCHSGLSVPAWRNIPTCRLRWMLSNRRAWGPAKASGSLSPLLLTF